jgi:elongation factor G
LLGICFATIKLKKLQNKYTLAGKGVSYKIAPIDFPEPKFRTAIKAVNTSEDEKLAVYFCKGCMQKILPFIFEYSKELKQMLIFGQGELHI